MAAIEITDRSGGPNDGVSMTIRAGERAEATLRREKGAWVLDYPVEPGTTREVRDPAVATEVVTAAADAVAGHGGGPLTLWVPHPDEDRETVAAAAGLAPGRVLYEMRRPLPVDDRARGGVAPLATRPFRPGQDEDAWLAVNNRAFAWHPEQGGWDRATIDAHEAEDWFDPDGFLLHETDGVVDGFCWTQVHAETTPVLGEIYVIAADPSAAGGGFGRRLVLAGLDHLSNAGVTVGMLYTDADNVRAVKLYVDMGFIVHHLHQAFTGNVPAV
jgi:mycothiol synthase